MHAKGSLQLDGVVYGVTALEAQMGAAVRLGWRRGRVAGWLACLQCCRRTSSGVQGQDGGQRLQDWVCSCIGCADCSH